MREFIDSTATQDGTFIDREIMMAIQGFEAKSIVFNNDGSFVETNSKGETLTTSFEEDGSIKQIFKGQKTITKNIKFQNGNIKEDLQ